MIRNFAVPSVFLAAVLAFAAAAPAEEQQPTTKPYPLTTCIVSGAKLGSMGEPVVIVHEGQEVKFCCAHCIEAFQKDPAKYLGQIEQKAAEAPTTQPSE